MINISKKCNELVHKEIEPKKSEPKMKETNKDAPKNLVANSEAFFLPPPASNKIPAGYTRLIDKLSEQDKEKIEAEYLEIEKAQKNSSAY